MFVLLFLHYSSTCPFWTHKKKIYKMRINLRVKCILKFSILFLFFHFCVRFGYFRFCEYSVLFEEVPRIRMDLVNGDNIGSLFWSLDSSLTSIMSWFIVCKVKQCEQLWLWVMTVGGHIFHHYVFIIKLSFKDFLKEIKSTLIVDVCNSLSAKWQYKLPPLGSELATN